MGEFLVSSKCNEKQNHSFDTEHGISLQKEVQNVLFLLSWKVEVKRKMFLSCKACLKGSQPLLLLLLYNVVVFSVL